MIHMSRVWVFIGCKPASRFYNLILRHASKLSGELANILRSWLNLYSVFRCHVIHTVCERTSDYLLIICDDVHDRTFTNEHGCSAIFTDTPTSPTSKSSRTIYVTNENQCEPPHDKTNKMTFSPAKTPIRLDGCPG